MALIEVQKISNGELPRGGKAYFGLFGNEEPETNPIQVYIDFELTEPLDLSISSLGVDLDRDGYTTVNGQRTDLYIGVDFSFMIRDSKGARFWQQARQITVIPTELETAQIWNVIGVSPGSADMGDYTGSIPDNETIKENIQHVGTLVDAAKDLQSLDVMKADLFFNVGEVRISSEYVTGTGNGSNPYEKVSIDPGFPLINPPTADGNWLKLLRNDSTNAYHSGALLDGVTNDLVSLQAYADYLASFVNGTNLDTTNKPIFYIPPSNGAVITAQLNIPHDISVIMDAPILVQAAANVTSPDGWVRINDTVPANARGRNLKFVIDVRRLTLSDWASDDDVGCVMDAVQAAEVWLRRFDNFTIGCRIGGAYSEIRLGEFRDNQIGMWYTNAASTFSTTTQFYGGEFAVINGSNNGLDRYGIKMSQSKVESMNSFVMNGQSYELSQAGAGAAEAIPMLVADIISLNAVNQRTEGNSAECFARLTGDCRWCTFELINQLQLGAGLNTQIDDQSTFKIGNVLSEHSRFNFANSYMIFDSGRLADKTIAYNLTQENIAGMEGINNTNPATFSRSINVTTINTDGSITLGTGLNSSTGVRINTRNCKKFAFVLDQDQANVTTCGIVAFDSSGTQLTASTDVLNNTSTPPVAPNLGVAGGFYFLTGPLDPPKNQHVITFSENVADAYFGFYDGDFFGLKIFVLENSAEVYTGDSAIVPPDMNIISQAPVVGLHGTGRVAFNEAPGVGATRFVCTAGGTPGTWISE